MSIFTSADILLPNNVDYSKWAVIACDQFTSQPEYWQEVKNIVGKEASTYNLIFPEAELASDREERIKNINAAMLGYLKNEVFTEYSKTYIYVERSLQNGSIRKGLIGVVDLEEYDYHKDSTSTIRATEQTVLERIPPRVEIRRNANLELPHILLLCDDYKKIIIEPLSDKKDKFPKLYDFDLMLDGGHITAWLIQGAEAAIVDNALAEYESYIREKYQQLDKEPLIYAVGDGNHSLATAKACYEETKVRIGVEKAAEHFARYALVELENIYDEAQVFEPIHRLLTNVDVQHFFENIMQASGEAGTPVEWFTNSASGVVYIKKESGKLPIETIQNILDDYLKNNSGEIDYIHGDETLKSLAKKENSIGLLMPEVTKNAFFEDIAKNGVMPRKTFSMGEAQEKRYYIEARKIL